LLPVNLKQLIKYLCAKVFLESQSVVEAIVDLISTYFVFDIIYPKSIYRIMVFIQHFVFDLKDEQSVPLAVSTLVTNINKLSNLPVEV